jgi:hypothetical protein
MPRSSLQFTYCEGKRRNCSVGQRTPFLPSFLPAKTLPPSGHDDNEEWGRSFSTIHSRRKTVHRGRIWTVRWGPKSAMKEPETRSQNESQHLDWNLNSSLHKISDPAHFLKLMKIYMHVLILSCRICHLQIMHLGQFRMRCIILSTYIYMFYWFFQCFKK